MYSATWRSAWVATACALIQLASAPVWAQAEGEGDDPAARAAEEAGDDEAGSKPAGESKPLPQIGEEDTLAVFVLQRGFYVSTDLGVFFSLGGVKGYSNIQPYLGLHAGFDVNDFLSLQASVSGAYVSGNPIIPYESAVAGNPIASYELLSIGAEVVGAYRPTQRFALEPKVGGGMSRTNPDPNVVDATMSVPKMNPHISAGLDLKYLTLLTDFTAGLSGTFYYVLGPNIPGLGLAFALRYTF